jgi:hypothetical protein
LSIVVASGTGSAQVDAHEAAQAGAVVQRLLANFVGQVEPVQDEVDAQHALRANRRASADALGIVRPGPITSHSAAHGTIAFIVAGNSSCRVGLRDRSKPAL